MCGWSEGRPKDWAGHGPDETGNVDEGSVEKGFFFFFFLYLNDMGLYVILGMVKDVFPYLQFFMQNPNFVFNISFCLILML